MSGGHVLHGHSFRGRLTPTYRAWQAMKNRCNYPSYKRYYDYGGRGIKVGARWNNSFENFLADMGEKPAGKSLDRIDNNGNYEPSNCRWSTTVEQSRNSRKTKWVTIDGECMCLKDWARRIGIANCSFANEARKLGITSEEACRRRVLTGSYR